MNSEEPELDDETVDEFVLDPVGEGELAKGFNTMISRKEIDVDEDTEGDDVMDAGVKVLTEFEVTGESDDGVGGDEIQLDLEEVLESGTTVTEAPEDD
jgi:hypothetical protein